MAEQSIRDDMSEELFKMYDHGTQPNAYVEADYLLASPVIRRIQAEALRSALADIQAYTDAGAPFGHRPVEQFLSLRADRVEAGELG